MTIREIIGQYKKRETRKKNVVKKKFGSEERNCGTTRAKTYNKKESM